MTAGAVSPSGASAISAAGFRVPASRRASSAASAASRPVSALASGSAIGTYPKPCVISGGQVRNFHTESDSPLSGTLLSCGLSEGRSRASRPTLYWSHILEKPMPFVHDRESEHREVHGRRRQWSTRRVSTRHVAPRGLASPVTPTPPPLWSGYAR